MPLYEYQCTDCGKIFEVLQKFTDPPPSECEACGGTVERLLSPPAIQFKGDGWYVTDYGRKNGGGSSDRKESSKSESTQTGSESASDSSASGTSKQD